MASLTPATLWLLRLSRMTMSPDRRVGHKNWRTYAKKQLAIHRPVGDQRRGQLLVAQASHKGGDFPMAVRGRSDTALSPRGTSIAPRHAGRCPGFIDKH